MTDPHRSLFQTIFESRLAKAQLVRILIFSSIITLMGTAIQLFVEYRDDMASLDTQLAQIESAHLDSLTNSLWLLDNRQIQIHLDNVLSLRDIVYLVISEKGQPLFSAGNRSSGRVKEKIFPMVYNRKGKPVTIGRLTVHASLDNVYSRLGRRIFIILITQGLKTFLVSFFILFILYHQVIRHLTRLAGFARDISLNNLDSGISLDRSANIGTQDELDLLVAQLNRMGHRLRTDLALIRETEKALRKSEERFDLAMLFANEGLFDWDLETGQVYFSPGWKRLLGYEDHEIRNQISEWERLTRKRDVLEAREMLDQVLSRERDRFEKELRMRHKNGRWVNILARANVIFNDQGKGIRIVGTHVDISDLKQIQETLRQREQELRAILHATPDPLVRYDEQGFPLYINPEFTKIFGWTIEDLAGARIPFVPEDQVRITAEKIEEVYLTGRPVKFVTTRLTQKGDLVDVIISAATIKKRSGKAAGMVVNFTDIREQKKLEFQLQQAQRMESVGRLAGGVAHDFNNMLSIILGHTDIILEDADPQGEFSLSIQEIQHAAQRSADLVRQLLAFARKQTIAPQVLDLNQTTQGMLGMLQRLIGENIHLAWRPDEALWEIKVDPTQIDQVLVNLCVNARDAIRGPGRITIETQNASLDEAYCRGRFDVSPGDYVMMAVSDNGCGMDKSTLEKLFEPFFTTKEVGRGTGLGLATIYGIVKQNNGMINVYSEPERGTTFRIYFPRHLEKKGRGKSTAIPVSIRGGNETILLVEDEQAMLRITSRMLERLGYRVLSASTPDQALHIAQTVKEPVIDLLITDVVMPDMNGRELAEKITGIFPRIRCLYMSGYTANIIAHHGVLEEGVIFISKPFSAGDIAAKVRYTLDIDLDNDPLMQEKA